MSKEIFLSINALSKPLRRHKDFDETEVVNIIDRLKRQGIIRKFVAILRHQQAGYEKNAMVVWAVPKSACEATGHLFASFKEITHCYERTPPFEGRYNIFTMIHFRKDKPDEFIQQLALLAGIADFKVLLSIEEFKKKQHDLFLKELRRYFFLHALSARFDFFGIINFWRQN